MRKNHFKWIKKILLNALASYETSKTDLFLYPHTCVVMRSSRYASLVVKGNVETSFHFYALTSATRLALVYQTILIGLHTSVTGSVNIKVIIIIGHIEVAALTGRKCSKAKGIASLKDTRDGIK